MSEYEDFLNKEENLEYKRLIKVLGENYFTDRSDELSFIVDEFKLNELLNNTSSIGFIKKTCLNFLINNNSSTSLNKTKNIFEAVENLFKLWKAAESSGFPPQFPIIIYFIIVASEMGENHRSNNFYSPLTEALGLEKSQKGEVEKSYTSIFSNNGKRLFQEINDWAFLTKNIKTTFKEGSKLNRKHVDWVVDQAIFNQKDLYVLTSFFKKIYILPNDIPNIEIFKSRLIHDFYIFTQERAWSSKFSKGLKRNLLEAINGDEDRLQIIVSIMHREANKWDGIELSSDGIRTVSTRLAFSEPDSKLGIEVIYNLFTTDLITNLVDQEAEKIVTDELEEVQEVTFKRDIYEDFWYIELQDFNNLDSNFKLKKHRINISTREKSVRVFANDNSDIHDFENLWVELNDNEKPDSTNTYSIVCQKSKKQIVLEYLAKNSEEISTPIELSDHYVFLNLTFLENREKQSNELKVLNSLRNDSYRLSFYGGLEIRNNLYLKDHLPYLIVPKEYSHEDYKLYINDLEVSFEPYLFDNNEIDLNNIEIDLDGITGELIFKVVNNDIIIDSKKIVYQDYPHTEYLQNSLESDLLAYDIELGENNEMYFNNINPKQIKSEDLKDGYVSGGYIKVTSEYKIPKSKFEKETINTNLGNIIIIGHKEGSKKKIIPFQNRFNFINNLENSNKLFTSNNLKPVFDLKVGKELNKLIHTEIPFSDSNAVWIIYTFNNRKKIIKIDSIDPISNNPNSIRSPISDTKKNKIVEKNLEWRNLILETNKNLISANDPIANDELWKKYVKFAESVKLY